MARHGFISRLRRAWSGLLPRNTRELTSDQIVGKMGEDAAAAHLRGLGMRIVARNARVPMGEADIIALDADGTHVIVEVKSRVRRGGVLSRSGTARPEDNLTEHKRAKLRHIAAWLRATNKWKSTRIDAVGVELSGEGAEHLRVREVRYWKGIA